MRKKHWLKITLITLAICAAAGLILSVILFSVNPAFDLMPPTDNTDNYFADRYDQ